MSALITSSNSDLVRAAQGSQPRNRRTLNRRSNT